MRTIDKVLVAGRGEVARRVLGTLRRMGFRTVAVHSEADARAAHLDAADEWVPLGPRAPDSELKIRQIVAAADQTGADAVHPGYGVVAESSDFAAACRQAGLLYIGAPTAVLDAVGDRNRAPQAARDAGLVPVPGSAPLASIEEARAEAGRLGYPVVMKSAVGLARLRRLDNETALSQALGAKQQRAASTGIEQSVYLERWLEGATPVDVPVALDHTGAAVHLGERAPLWQRGALRLVEESPSSALSAELRQRAHTQALGLARALGYQGLGTVELLVQGDAIYFVALRTRLQVDHPLTEMVWGIDLVEWQIRLALDEPLPAAQDEMSSLGHAVQCRLYPEPLAAEPDAYRIQRLEAPVGEGLRHDLGFDADAWISTFQDPLIAKVTALGSSRADALERLREALEGYVVEGVDTNLAVLRQRLAALSS